MVVGGLVSRGGVGGAGLEVERLRSLRPGESRDSLGGWGAPSGHRDHTFLKNGPVTDTSPHPTRSVRFSLLFCICPQLSDPPPLGPLLWSLYLLLASLFPSLAVCLSSSFVVSSPLLVSGSQLSCPYYVIFHLFVCPLSPTVSPSPSLIASLLSASLLAFLTWFPRSGRRSGRCWERRS